MYVCMYVCIYVCMYVCTSLDEYGVGSVGLVDCFQSGGKYFDPSTKLCNRIAAKLPNLTADMYVCMYVCSVCM